MQLKIQFNLVGTKYVSVFVALLNLSNNIGDGKIIFVVFNINSGGLASQ